MMNRRFIAAAGLVMAAQPAVAQSARTPNGGAAGATFVTQGVATIANLADLTARPEMVLLAGFHHAQDGGGGLFQWVEGDETPPDGALSIRPKEGPPGRFKRIMSGPVDVRWFGTRGDGVADDTEALQKAIDHSATDDLSGPALYIPGGKYRITAPLIIRRQFFQMQGDGVWRTQILFEGVTGGAIVAEPIKYLRPVLRDFSLVGDAASGRGIDFSKVFGEVYLGEFKNLCIFAGDDGIYSIRFFSMVVDNVSAASYRGHSFRVACGPAVSWRNCYALRTGPGKAGYRLAGTIAMYSCNGLNEGDYWGVFGCDPSAADGFEKDFPERNYPDVTLISCNVEDFCSRVGSEKASAIVIHEAFRQFTMLGGKLDRNNPVTPYHSAIRCRRGASVPGVPIRLGPGSVFPGKGVPTASFLYSDIQAFFVDETGFMSAIGINTWREGGIDYPVVATKIVHDMYGQSAMHFSALSTDRLSARALRFDEAILVAGPAGTLQSAGHSLITTANTSPKTITALSLETPGRSDPVQSQNAMMIVRVDDEHTTFKHLHGGPDGMRLKASADYKARKGDVLLFMRSNFYDGVAPGWVQI